MSSRIFIALSGTWLVVSAFAWPHTGAQTLNTAISGGLCVLLALLSMSYEWARYLNLAVAVWLLVSTFRMTTLSTATWWNDAIFAAAIFFAAMIGGGPKEIRHEHELYGRTT